MTSRTYDKAHLARFLPISRAPEWQPNRACWLAWPSHEKEWLDHLQQARAEFVALCRAIADPHPITGEPQGEQLEILVLDEAGKAEAKAYLGELPVRFHIMPFGDIWLRDIAPIFVTAADGSLGAATFNFNGWGGKYILPGDETVAANIAQFLGVPQFHFPLVLEGGAVETDGRLCLTTRQCLLNPNRNPHLTREEIEDYLRSALGVSKILWLNRGLLCDHTDGHIDTIARFVAPGVVLCMEALDTDDPNAEILEEIARDLASFCDRGIPLEIHRIPSPGKITSDRSEIMPASYLNFYIGNRCAIVPTYGSPYDELAVEAISQFFPNRRTIGLPAKSILTGGGAFHCITQNQP